jgi:predicted nucleic acid-binding protein
MEEVRGEELYEDVEQLVSQGFARVAEASNLDLVELLSAGLGMGEAETIALASDVSADLALLDDLKARKAARRLGIRVMGTLGTLKLLMMPGTYMRALKSCAVPWWVKASGLTQSYA